MNIELKGPVTVTLQPQTVVTMLKALHKLPYEEASGPINDLVEQIQKATAPAPAPLIPPGAAPIGDTKK